MSVGVREWFNGALRQTLFPSLAALSMISDGRVCSSAPSQTLRHRLLLLTRLLLIFRLDALPQRQRTGASAWLVTSATCEKITAMPTYCRMIVATWVDTVVG